MGVVVSVVVVGACIAFVVWFAVSRNRGEDATTGAGSGREPEVAAGAPLDGDTPWWVRIRSAAALGCLSVGLGVAVAAGVGVVVLVLFVLLRSSVG